MLPRWDICNLEIDRGASEVGGPATDTLVAIIRALRAIPFQVT